MLYTKAGYSPAAKLIIKRHHVTFLLPFYEANSVADHASLCYDLTMSDAVDIENARESLKANIPQPVKDAGVKEVHEADNITEFHSKDAAVPNLNPADTRFAKIILEELKLAKDQTKVRRELKDAA